MTMNLGPMPDIKSSREVEESFLRQSNFIEREYGDVAFEDAWDAWHYAKQIQTMTVLDVLNIHGFLMRRLRPDIAGKWRNCDVYVGGRRCVFVSHQLIEEELKAILGGMNDRSHAWYRPDEHARRLHVLFEALHPFEDGNGRVGRILWQWHRRRLGLPIQVIHEGKEQWEYYKWFK